MTGSCLKLREGHYINYLLENLFRTPPFLFFYYPKYSIFDCYIIYPSVFTGLLCNFVFISIIYTPLQAIPGGMNNGDAAGHGEYKDNHGGIGYPVNITDKNNGKKQLSNGICFLLVLPKQIFQGFIVFTDISPKTS